MSIFARAIALATTRYLQEKWHKRRNGWSSKVSSSTYLRFKLGTEDVVHVDLHLIPDTGQCFFGSIPFQSDGTRELISIYDPKCIKKSAYEIERTIVAKVAPFIHFDIFSTDFMRAIFETVVRLVRFQWKGKFDEIDFFNCKQWVKQCRPSLRRDKTRIFLVMLMHCSNLISEGAKDSSILKYWRLIKRDLISVCNRAEPLEIQWLLKNIEQLFYESHMILDTPITRGNGYNLMTVVRATQIDQSRFVN